MHIPDGYLSPTTCVVLYGVSAPFWYVALQRAKRAVGTFAVPLLSVFSAFSFVVMMFNLPLPGGTTGHAVGVSLAAVVLGPWGAMLAVSIALAIQALCFGDGGITTFGANCFNMAICGALVAYGVYRLLAYRAPLDAFRRVIAASVAGYLAINVSALLAAVEFGLQPLLFHDGRGQPLYAPYPLSVAIPAMMIGHLTFAGLAELVVTGGVVAYLQRSQIEMLRTTAPDAPEGGARVPAASFGTRRLWIAVAILLAATPLGLLAVGGAWGEWTPQELSSRLTAPHAPPGLDRLFSFWNAPLSRYALPSSGNSEAGYLVSALLGVALIVCVFSLARFLLRLRSPKHEHRRDFLASSTKALLAIVEQSLEAEQLAARSGLLQRLDPRVKLAGLLALVVAVAAAHRLSVIALLFGVACLLALLSRIWLRALLLAVWLPVLSFTGLLALPALFLTPGVGFGWQITQPGWQSALLLVSRTETSATLAALIVLSSPWTRVLRALRFCRVPALAVVVIGMAYRYLFLLLRTALEMLESRRSRTVGVLPPSERGRLAAAAVGSLLSKTLQLSLEVHSAMRARGFGGEVYVLEEGALTRRDWAILSLFWLAAIAALVGGRM